MLVIDERNFNSNIMNRSVIIIMLTRGKLTKLKKVLIKVNSFSLFCRPYSKGRVKRTKNCIDANDNRSFITLLLIIVLVGGNSALMVSIGFEVQSKVSKCSTIFALVFLLLRFDRRLGLDHNNISRISANIKKKQR